MKYIRIKNSGIIEPQALHLVGASTKRNDNTKIGQFGSGNKYALAYFLRNGYNVKVFAGLEEIVITTEEQQFRDETFEIIFINGKETSITTEMGKDWQFWQAIREIYCNALDEGGFGIDYLCDYDPKDGETHFYIEKTADANEFLSNFDNYFSLNKKVLFEVPGVGRILEKTGTVANIYRRGIRCFETNKSSVYDYDFDDLDIDENRLLKYYWLMEGKIWQLVYKCENPEIILQILHGSEDKLKLEGSISDYTSLNSTMSDTFVKTVRSLNLAPASFSGCLNPDEIHNHIKVPTKVFTSIRGVLDDENVGDKFKVTHNGGLYVLQEPTELQTATIDQALYFFKEVQYKIDYPIVIASFENKAVLGYAHDGNIIVSDIAVERGVNDLCNTIIEEQVHLKHGVKDETRAFQTACIAEFVTYMKINNSFLL